MVVEKREKQPKTKEITEIRDRIEEDRRIQNA
jgi:hypothetical protein